MKDENKKLAEDSCR